METRPTKSKVLDAADVQRKLRRMALQVAEQNWEEQSLVVAGVSGNGAVVARNLVGLLNQVSDLRVEAINITLDKKDPGEVVLHPAIDLQNKVVLLVDDVANTGRTLLYALKPFLNSAPKKIQTLVLVERSHKLFPIQTDYAGLSIATTLQEHILVETRGEDIIGAWLQ